MQLVFTSVERALGDSSSLLSRALGAAVKVGMSVPARALARSRNQAAILAGGEEEEDDATR